MMNFIKWALRAEPMSMSTGRGDSFKIMLMEGVTIMIVDVATEEDMEGMMEVADDSSTKLIKGIVEAITHSMTRTRVLRSIQPP